MKPRICENTKCKNSKEVNKSNFIKNGSYTLKTGKKVQLWKCKLCNKSATRRSGHLINQSKPWLLKQVWNLTCRGMSQRDMALVLKCSRTTIVRKTSQLAELIEWHHANRLQLVSYKHVYFDEMTINSSHNDNPMRIGVLCSGDKVLDFYIADAPKTGGMKKEGAVQKVININPFIEMEAMFRRSRGYLVKDFIITTDKGFGYKDTMRKAFSGLTYTIVQFSAKEAMQIQPNPLQPINNIHASMRHRLARFRRKTQCITKRLDRLEEAVFLYIGMFNRYLIFDFQKKAIPRTGTDRKRNSLDDINDEEFLLFLNAS